MSKGSKRRPGDDAAYAEHYERIFGAAALRAAKRRDEVTQREDCPPGLLEQMVSTGFPFSGDMAKAWALRNPAHQRDDARKEET